MPYITASIIVQLLTVVIPRLEALKKEGQPGTAKITQYTRYLTIGLAILQSTGLDRAGPPARPAVPAAAPRTSSRATSACSPSLVMVITMTAGTGVIMWLGELITDRGVGNGMSLLIFTSIAAGFPASLWQIQHRATAGPLRRRPRHRPGRSSRVVFVEQAQRRIPVQYAKRMVGRRMYGGTSTYIPLKVNQAGVIPVIFASSLLYLPALVAPVHGPATTAGWVHWVRRYLVTRRPPDLHVAYFVLIVFFTYFYVAITFNPTEVADNMKKYGGFIPGIRAGRPTAEYLDYVLSRITAAGRALPGRRSR